MLKQLALWLFIFATFASFPMSAVEDKEKEKATIKQLIFDYGKAANEHDAQAMASFWDEDCDLITLWGQIGTGHDAIERILTGNNASKLKQAQQIESIEFIRLITPTVATADVENTTIGVIDDEGRVIAPFHNHGYYVVVNKDGKWRISAYRSYVMGASKKLILEP